MSNEIQREQPVRVIHPPVDALENEDGLLLRADLPGVSSDGLSIELDNGVLTLTARRPLYEQADLTVDTSAHPLEHIVLHLAQKLA